MRKGLEREIIIKKDIDITHGTLNPRAPHKVSHLFCARYIIATRRQLLIGTTGAVIQGGNVTRYFSADSAQQVSYILLQRSGSYGDEERDPE